MQNLKILEFVWFPRKLKQKKIKKKNLSLLDVLVSKKMENFP